MVSGTGARPDLDCRKDRFPNGSHGDGQLLRDDAARDDGRLMLPDASSSATREMSAPVPTACEFESTMGPS